MGPLFLGFKLFNWKMILLKIYQSKDLKLKKRPCELLYMLWFDEKVNLENAVYKERVTYAFVFIKSSWGLERTFPHQKLFLWLCNTTLCMYCLNKASNFVKKFFKLYGWHFVFSEYVFPWNQFHEIFFVKLISQN